METNRTLKTLLDSLMDTAVLNSWQIYQGKHGKTMVKLCFDGDNGGERNKEEVNSNAHFKRKTDSQINRDINRVKKHSETTSVNTRPIVNKRQNDRYTDNSSEIELGRCDSNLVDSIDRIESDDFQASRVMVEQHSCMDSPDVFVDAPSPEPQPCRKRNWSDAQSSETDAETIPGDLVCDEASPSAANDDTCVPPLEECFTNEELESMSPIRQMIEYMTRTVQKPNK